MKLTRDFYRQDSYTLAQELLGKVLVIDNRRWRIVETEAYGGATDRAAHSYQYLRTKRTEPMFLDGGHVYIYFIYGMYYMFNIVANKPDIPEAVLIRSVSPIADTMKTNTAGPGKLCRTLGIDSRYNSVDLVTSEFIWIEDDSYPVEIVSSKRIGIDYALEDKDRLWRFYIRNHPYISKQ